MKIQHPAAFLFVTSLVEVTTPRDTENTPGIQDSCVPQPGGAVNSHGILEHREAAIYAR